MKHLSFLRRHANIVFCLLLCLVYQRAESKELFENNSLDTCYVLAIANVDLTTDLQKKYEERNIATSAIVGYSFSDDEVKIYLLDDRYDFDLYSIQKGDSITLHYPHTSQEKEKKAIAIHNHSFQERIRKNDSIYFVEDDNIRSKRLCERLGMRREGCFKEFVTFVNNPDGSPKYEDTCVYAILEKEWNTIRQW